MEEPFKSRVTKVNNSTPAARCNARAMRALRKKLESNPEADIIGLLGPKYSETLESFKAFSPKGTAIPAAGPTPGTQAAGMSRDDARLHLKATDTSTVLCEFSKELADLLHPVNDLSQNLVRLLAASQVIYKATPIMVLRLCETIVVKITANAESALTEHRSLSYLAQNIPDFPVPRPQGVARLGHMTMLFTTFIEGVDLEKAWPGMSQLEKRSISDQIDVLLCRLRTVTLPEGTQLGAFGDAGCKDARRSIRVSSHPIKDADEFQDFIFSGSEATSPMYRRLLRSLAPTSQTRVVLTHGDIRPANIIVRQNSTGDWSVAALIDWESSGFYPDYWESVKATNNLIPWDRLDWYEFLPESISPQRHRIDWLLDRLWDRHLVNS